MLSILITDDHGLVRLGVRHLLQKAVPDVVTGEAANAEEALALIGQRAWDLVVLDITMPGRSGLDILKDIHNLKPRLPLLVFSAHAQSDLILRALKSGAAGFVAKTSPPEELAKAIDAVLKGTKYVSEHLAQEVVLKVFSSAAGLPHETLSDREYEVLRMIASGQTPTRIAQKLDLSVKTVSTYRVRILSKMGMHTTAELMYYGINHELPL